MNFRRIAPVAAAAAALVLAPAAVPKGVPLVGIVGDRILSQQLARFDPSTLKPLAAGRVPLAGHHLGWSFSPNGGTLALGANNESCVGGSSTLRLVDLRAMRTLGDVPLVRNGPVLASAWPDARHVVAILAAGDCISSTHTAVVTVDAGTRTVVARTSLRGDVVRIATSPGRVAILLAPHERLGAARLAVVDAGGDVRQVTLGRISAGQRLSHDVPPVSSVSWPALAIDDGTTRAFVVPAGDRLAEVDLVSMRVRYHQLSERVSTFTRFKRWLVPAAGAKGASGPSRQALWLGNGLLAVTGTDMTDGAGGFASTAAGLRLVDTRSWRYRKLSADVSSVELVGGLLLATGSSYRASGTTHTESGAGLVAYSLDGHERYHVLADAQVYAVGGWVSIAGGTGSSRTYALDAATGRLGRQVETEAFRLLVPGRLSPYGP